MSIYDRIDKDCQKIPLLQSYQSLNFESSRPCPAPFGHVRADVSTHFITKNNGEKNGIGLISAKTRFFKLFGCF